MTKKKKKKKKKITTKSARKSSSYRRGRKHVNTTSPITKRFIDMWGNRNVEFSVTNSIQ